MRSGFTPDRAIKVKVEKGFVTLTGEVEWHYQQEAAKLDVQHLHGVVGVANNVSLKSGRGADDIGASIKLALKRSWYTRPDSISVTDTAGKLKLSRVVHSPHVRFVAGETA